MIQRLLDYIKYQKSIPSESELNVDMMYKYGLYMTLERLDLV